jgi:predicted naringenin-chalcone synthase
MSFITAIGTANPANRIAQEVLAGFMSRAMQLDDHDSRRLRAIFRASGIAYRHSVLDDYGKAGDYDFFPNSPDFEPFPGTARRMDVFRQNALPLSVAAVEDMKRTLPAIDMQGITHLIVVCCTGMYAPGLDIGLVQHLGLSPQVQRTCITFMGCYAAFNALKVADAFVGRDNHSKVLIVCTELCSLHFQKQISDDNLLANALFADGAAAVLVEGTAQGNVSLALESFYNDLMPEGAGDMAWSIGDVGFEMKLSSYVPDIIRQGIGKLTHKLLDSMAIAVDSIAHFAIHPGGRKILETIEAELNIPKARNDAAYQVLKNYGNMSSPTVLFVLKEICRRLNGHDDDALIMSFAFGPGLTMESMLLRIKMNNHA